MVQHHPDELANYAALPAFAADTGWCLLKSIIFKQNGFYVFCKNPNGHDEEVYGWKLHISVEPSKVAEAYRLLLPILLKYASLFKVTNIEKTPSDERCMRGAQFTVYLQKTLNQALFITPVETKQLVQEITSALEAANIGPGKIPESDAPAQSPYFSMRNDLLLVIDIEHEQLVAEYLPAAEIGGNYNPSMLSNPFRELLLDQFQDPSLIQQFDLWKQLDAPNLRLESNARALEIIAATYLGRHLAISPVIQSSDTQQRFAFFKCEEKKNFDRAYQLILQSQHEVLPHHLLTEEACTIPHINERLKFCYQLSVLLMELSRYPGGRRPWCPLDKLAEYYPYEDEFNTFLRHVDDVFNEERQALMKSEKTDVTPLCFAMEDAYESYARSYLDAQYPPFSFSDLQKHLANPDVYIKIEVLKKMYWLFKEGKLTPQEQQDYIGLLDQEMKQGNLCASATLVCLGLTGVEAPSDKAIIPTHDKSIDILTNIISHDSSLALKAVMLLREFRFKPKDKVRDEILAIVQSQAKQNNHVANLLLAVSSASNSSLSLHMDSPVFLSESSTSRGEVISSLVQASTSTDKMTANIARALLEDIKKQIDSPRHGPA